jgi:hypothetical protein
MNEVPIAGRDEADRAVMQFVAHYDAPAYVRRARRVQQVYDLLLDRCRRQRDEWLAMVRIRLGTLRALAGEWHALRPYLADDEQLRALADLHAALQPRLRVPVEPTASARALRRAMAELAESIERFNRRWAEFLRGVDVSAVNEERDGYNRYFLLEKECAVRLPHVARRGFEPLRPLTRDDVASLLPPLPGPRAAPPRRPRRAGANRGGGPLTPLRSARGSEAY